MNLLAPISSIMTTKVHVLDPIDTLDKVEKLFNDFNIHHLPVVDKAKLVGMVSLSDFLSFKKGYLNFVENTTEKHAIRDEHFRLKTTSVTEIMTTGLAKLEPNDRINVALDIFNKNLFHALPIVEKDELIGIVTTYDIISNLAKSKAATNTYETS